MFCFFLSFISSLFISIALVSVCWIRSCLRWRNSCRFFCSSSFCCCKAPRYSASASSILWKTSWANSGHGGKLKFSTPHFHWSAKNMQKWLNPIESLRHCGELSLSFLVSPLKSFSASIRSTRKWRHSCNHGGSCELVMSIESIRYVQFKKYLWHCQIVQLNMFESQTISLNSLPQQIPFPVHQLHKVSLQLDPSP